MKHKHYYCIRAFADGWKLMQCIHVKKAWFPIDYPNFHPDAEYRVVPDENGWLPWYGGECPTSPNTLIEVKYRNYGAFPAGAAGLYNWRWCDSVADIVAYRIVEEAVADPYAELKAAAKDPTKEVRCLHEASGKEWLCNRPECFAWSHPPEYYEIRDKPLADPYAGLKAAAKDPTKQIKYTFPDGVSDGWHDYNHDWLFKGLLSGYEIRNKPKKKKIKLLAWVEANGNLNWRKEGYEYGPYWSRFWKRVPSEDKEIEVEE